MQVAGYSSRKLGSDDSAFNSLLQDQVIRVRFPPGVQAEHAFARLVVADTETQMQTPVISVGCSSSVVLWYHASS